MTIDDIVRTLQTGFDAVVGLLSRSDRRNDRYDRQLDFLQRLQTTTLVNLQNAQVKTVPANGFIGVPDPDAAALIYKNTKKHPVAIRIKAQRASGALPMDPFFYVGPRSFVTDTGVVPMAGFSVRPQRYWVLDNLQEVTIILRPDEEIYSWKPGVIGAGGLLFWSLLDPEAMWELNQGEGVAQK